MPSQLIGKEAKWSCDEYYLAVKRNKLLTTRWMNPKRAQRKKPNKRINKDYTQNSKKAN